MLTNKYFSCFFILLIFFLLFGTNLAISSPILKISVPQKNISVSYQTAPRLSQLLLDIYENVDYSIYILGSALIPIENSRNIVINNTKKQLLESLKSINETNSLNLYRLLDDLDFLYQEDLSLDLEKVQINTKINPVISGSYQLFLPRRPDYIRLIDPNTSDKIIKIKIKPGYKLKEYLKDHKSNSINNITENISIIQADKKLLSPKLGYGRNRNYYLSPGATIFIGLNKNTKKAQEINKSFSKLLQNHVVY